MGSGSADQLFHAFVDGASHHHHIPLLGKQVSETNIISGMFAYSILVGFSSSHIDASAVHAFTKCDTVQPGEEGRQRARPRVRAVAHGHLGPSGVRALEAPNRRQAIEIVGYCLL